MEPRGTLPRHARMQGPCTYPMRRSWHAFEPLTWVIAPLRTPLKQISDTDAERSDRSFVLLILRVAARDMSSGAVSMSEILSLGLYCSRFRRLTRALREASCNSVGTFRGRLPPRGSFEFGNLCCLQRTLERPSQSSPDAFRVGTCRKRDSVILITCDTYVRA